MEMSRDEDCVTTRRQLERKQLNRRGRGLIMRKERGRKCSLHMHQHTVFLFSTGFL